MYFLDLLSHFSMLLCFILSLSYFLFKKVNSTNILIAMLWFLTGLLQLQFYLIYTKKLLNYPFMFMTYVPTIMLIGPLVYFYFESMSVSHFKLNLRKSRHLLPPLFTLIMFMPFFIKSSAEKVFIIESLYLGQNILFYFPFSLLAGLSAIAYVIYIIKQQPFLSKFKSLFSRNVFYVFACINLVFTTLVLLTLSHPYWSLQVIKFGSFALTILSVFFFLMTHHFQDWIDTSFFDLQKNKYEKSRLKEINLDDLNKTLISLMEEKHLYQKKDLKIKDIADEIGISSHQLSEYLNNQLDKNFNTFIFYYRIKKAKELLVKYPWKTTLAIGTEVGFNSFSSFNMVFKKETGHSPGKYRKDRLPQQ